MEIILQLHFSAGYSFPHDLFSIHLQVVLHLQLKLGQLASSNSSLAWEYDNMQYSLQQFYSTLQDDGILKFASSIYVLHSLNEHM